MLNDFSTQILRFKIQIPLRGALYQYEHQCRGDKVPNTYNQGSEFTVSIPGMVELLIYP